MIYILHGDDIVKARTLIVNQQKKLNIEKRTELELSEVTPTKLYEIVHSASLFGEPLFLVLNISKGGNKNLEPYVQVLKGLKENINVVVLTDKPLTQTNAFLKNATSLDAKIMELNKEPEGNIFRLLDSIFTKDRKKNYSELHKVIEDGSDDFEIFSRMLYGLRTLTAAKLNAPSFQKLKDFQKGKLNSQAKGFTEESIKNIYWEFMEIDKKVKTGEIMPELMLTLAIEKVLNS